MVDKFQNILKQIEKKHGKVSLFALLKMDEYVNKWSLILSADWISDKNRKIVFRDLVKILNTQLNSEESSTVGRIGILENNEHLVSELIQYKSGSDIKERVQVNGNIIHEGYIFASNASSQ